MEMAVKFVRPSVILVKDKKILVLKSKYSSGEFYLLPGGDPEGFETLEQTAIRETKEETGYDIKIKNLKYIQEWINVSRKKNVLYYIFLGEIISGKQTHLDDPCFQEGHIQCLEWKTIQDLEKTVFFPKGLLTELKSDLSTGFKKDVIIMKPDLENSQNRNINSNSVISKSFQQALEFLGKPVKVKIDRQLGSKHPKWGFVYEANYGFVEGIVAPDGEELDAYVLLMNKPLSEFSGTVAGIVHRIKDDDDKLVVIPEGEKIGKEQIEDMTAFQEKWFEHKIILSENE
jgi:inorganic pyrophosphatase